MSMVGNYYMTDEETIKKLQNGEVSLESLIYDEDDNVDEEASLDIDKAWHAIYYVLTCKIEEGDQDNVLIKSMLSGNYVNDEDMGFGPAMLITADEVKMVNQEIKDIGEAIFRGRVSIKEMVENEIHPVMEDEDEDEFFEYIWTAFESLKAFYSKAAAEGKCLLFYID